MGRNPPTIIKNKNHCSSNAALVSCFACIRAAGWNADGAYLSKRKESTMELVVGRCTQGYNITLEGDSDPMQSVFSWARAKRNCNLIKNTFSSLQIWSVKNSWVRRYITKYVAVLSTWTMYDVWRLAVHMKLYNTYLILLHGIPRTLLSVVNCNLRLNLWIKTKSTVLVYRYTISRQVFRPQLLNSAPYASWMKFSPKIRFSKRRTQVLGKKSNVTYS